MNFKIGQKVSYPNHGVCKIENIGKRKISEDATKFYSLRVLANNSEIYVPTGNAESIGIRPIITGVQCRGLMEFLAKDFDEPEMDWKIRTREFGEKLQTGDAFETAEVLKKLVFLARLKKLSFREQKMFEKAKFLIVSELATACSKKDCQVEKQVDELLEAACQKHDLEKVELVFAATHW
ncbi:MAG: CarD family transcriptional regulator [Pyrinomonadaceae bacterium]